MPRKEELAKVWKNLFPDQVPIDGSKDGMMFSKHKLRHMRIKTIIRLLEEDRIMLSLNHLLTPEEQKEVILVYEARRASYLEELKRRGVQLCQQ